MLRSETNYIVIHTTATPPSADIGVEEIREMHLARGWRDIGYHLVLRRNGILETGRPIDEIGAHVRGHNHDSVSIAWVGGVDEEGHPEDNRTDRQKDVLPAAIAMLRMMYPYAVVRGHRDFSPDLDGSGEVEPDEWIKACPSFEVSDEYAYRTTHSP